MTAGVSPDRLSSEACALALGELAASWRVLDSPAADGATNMAIDSLLLEDARRTGVATLRIYEWSRPTLSLGRHERARGRFSAPRLAAEGIDVVRRITGGRALLHHREVTYSVAAPVALTTTGDAASPTAHAGWSGALRDRYAAINRLLADALARLGVRAAPAPPRAPTLRPGQGACFTEPNVGELVVDGAKLVASAQIVEDGAFLQHGSILLHDDQSRIAALSNDPEFPATRAATLIAALGRPVDAAEVRRVLVDALQDALQDALERALVTPPLILESLAGRDSDLQRHRARFLDGSWTWQR